MTLTPDRINQAWKLRAKGASYRKIAEALGSVSAKTVRSALYPNGRRPEHKIPYHRSPDVHRVVKQINRPPVDVLDQREKAYQARMSAHLTIGQQLLGDPLPGRSALDQRKTNVHAK